MSIPLIIKPLQRQDYTSTWQAMKSFTEQRDANTPDEIWLIEHPAVFTLGQSGKHEHLLNPGNIPVLQVDRGGQVTYHGPGQLIVYVMLDIRRRHMTVRQLVSCLEQAVIDLLATHHIEASARTDAPGVYVGSAKICSLGLRIRRGYTYHGLALNVAMDLEPFSRINPCGFKNLPITQMADLIGHTNIEAVAPTLLQLLIKHLEHIHHES